MADTGHVGTGRIIRNGGFSFKGFVTTLKHESAFRQEVALSILLIPLALWLGDNTLERAVMIGAWLIVPTVEMLNLGVEAVVVRIDDESHPLARRVRALGSAAVFLAFTNAAIVWAILLFG